MGDASPVIAGTTWELMRRCAGRMFLLRPDADVVRALLYCFAYCADQHGMLVHALSLMDNHYHDTVTDVRGARVDFTHELHQLSARCVKALRGENGKPMPGPVWEASEATGRVLIASEQGLIDSLAYVMANPVAAGLVRDVRDWPSFVSTPDFMLENRAITLKRPACLDGTSYPKTATLRFCVPPGLRAAPRAFVTAVKERLKQRIDEARKEMRLSGRSYPTAEQLASVSPFSAPKTERTKHAGVPMYRAVTAAAIRRVKQTFRAWRRAYRAAFEAFREGKRDVEWPAGTWWFARYAGARVAPADDWPLG